MKRPIFDTKAIGSLGEAIAAKYLEDQNHIVIQRNYWKKWGEIDLVTRGTSGNIHFIEVKAVSYETKQDLEEAVSYGTWRPEEQVHQFKLHQIHKALESWIQENSYMGNWQIDVVGVRLVPREKFATANYIANIT